MAAPLFDEWHRAVNTPLSASMMSNLSSNQARWDLICQQESRISGMAESIVSTSSSSGGGGTLSRRGSLEPPPNAQHRLSRSSADDENDSEDQCHSFPYMPLDSVDSNFIPPSQGLTLLSPRRHSLPFQESDDISTLESSLHRQMSLIDSKRRANAVQELRKQNSELLNSLKTSKRRRVFKKANSAAVAENSNVEKTKVTFHLSSSVDMASEVTPEVAHLLKVNQRTNQRRGSAPCTLLLNQINKIANSASKVASTASREHSPRNRRNSLPGNEEILNEAIIATSMNKKKRKLLRRKSAGAGDGVSAPSEDPRVMLSSKRKNPALGKRGSLRSSSFGGVGMSQPNPNAKMYSARPKFHHHFRNNANFSELRLLEESIIDVTGRRGSLPCELILC